MTPFFIKKFQKQHKCPSCPAKKLTEKSMCAYHLRIAREEWANWAGKRRSEGKCSYCDRKSFNGWLRCRAHTAYNRAKCAAWMATHPNYGKERWEIQKREYISQGLCRSCKEHRPAEAGKAKCRPCLDRNAALKRGDLRPWEGTSKGGTIGISS